MADSGMLGRTRVFADLPEAELREIAARMRPRVFEAGEHLCRAGEPSDCLWLITGGLVHLLAPPAGGGPGEVVDRLRKGDVVGEVGVIAGDVRSATVVARISTSALELDAVDYVDLVRRHPQILINMIGMLRGRLARARLRSIESPRSETVAVATGSSLGDLQSRLVAAARQATAKPVTLLDRRFSFAGAVTAADDLSSGHGIVVLAAELEPRTIAALVSEVDRVIVLAGTDGEAASLGELRRRANTGGESVEVVLVGQDAVRGSRAWPADTMLRVVRTCAREELPLPISAHDLSWLARHLTRTKIGLALGAGGAKGYAHVGALEVLEEAGYAVDYVSGSSIGAIVGAYLALGMSAAAIDSTLRRSFDSAAVEKIFKTSLAGATGLEVMTRLLRETTGDRGFEDTLIPLTVMTVDLSERSPAPLREGHLWEALLGATALAGVFPPHERDGHLLVDGLALVPVPTGSLLEDGADLTISVNLMSADTLARWPGGPPPEPPPERRRRRGMLDTLLEVMDLSQQESSVQHAGLADVVITPRFGPCHWRDFHLADLFLAAGRAAAAAQLPRLRSLALPVTSDIATDSEGGSIERPGAVHI